MPLHTRVYQAADADSAFLLVPSQFCGAIVLIFFLELAVAVLAFLFQDWVRDRFREFFESNIRSYRDDIDLQNLIDSLQKAVSSAPDRPPARACPFPPPVSLGCPAAEMEPGLPSSEWVFCHSMAGRYGACPSASGHPRCAQLLAWQPGLPLSQHFELVRQLCLPFLPFGSSLP